ncbi:MAG TPA: hypothetical protein VF435_19215, partial [Pyrinomonadaceae bacterium]
MSIPYVGKEFTFPQPDGTKLKVRGFGNQENAVFETLDGYTVTHDPETGFYQYAALSNDGNELAPTGYQAERADPKNLGLAKGIRANSLAASMSDVSPQLSTRKTRWQTRRENTRMEKSVALEAGLADVASARHQTVGNFVGLCLLVDFPDVPGTIPREDVEAFCNQPEYNGFGNNGSVRDYFFDNSGGRLHYTNIVTPYVTAKHNKS